MSDSVAKLQLRAFVERILRMKEEAKAINDDIREIYAEAKGNGFDKTVLGKLVSYVEKRAKSADTLAEQDALFDLYLAAYDGREETEDRPSRTHAHVHARDLPEHDADGVIIEPQSATSDSSSPVVVERATDSPPDGQHDAGEAAAPQSSPASILPPVSAAQTVTVQGNEPGPTSSPEHEAVESSGPVSPAGEVAADKSGEAPVASPAPPVTDYVVFFDADADARCRKPEQCGSFSRLGVCQPCREAWEADHPQKVAAE